MDRVRPFASPPSSPQERGEAFGASGIGATLGEWHICRAATSVGRRMSASRSGP